MRESKPRHSGLKFLRPCRHRQRNQPSLGLQRTFVAPVAAERHQLRVSEAGNWADFAPAMNGGGFPPPESLLMNLLDDCWRQLDLQHLPNLLKDPRPVTSLLAGFCQ